ncbi:adenine glycosylase [Microlunatus endophyticus]|uniref:Adenine DNA glycosylase n=1 Tax=Microlunatus endophyticus TaxID=1716077 RepID=A0A917W1T3_9ACTN|nr:A/G-specific adenine glycosylase [Microlunatus endophyticus]GGL59020.1 adenine glycosylase [Microlunatus endophyticus]
MDYAPVVSRTLRWYAHAARDLPWRRPDAGPWAIMVSEFMLQQTPVARVLQPWQDWVQRWPTPAALADAPSGEAVRAWGRLGYPRRALRLHQAATAIRDDHDGQVPDDYQALLALPGVGSYTAAAIASFAFGRRHVVLDTNVRRVQARIATGIEFPATAPTAAERLLAEQFLPTEPARAARWAVASMELGALICTARGPQCDQCPVRTDCAWHRAGRPAHEGPARVGQRYQGTDRQCRGALLAVLRSSDDAVPAEELDTAWPDRAQRERALASLITDRLVVAVGPDRYALPD